MAHPSESATPQRPSSPPAGAGRRALRARGNRLKVGLRIGNRGVTEALIDELRRLFDRDDLIKVRVDAEDKAEVEAVAEELCHRAGCHRVQRVGRVILLYHPKSEDSS